MPRCVFVPSWADRSRGPASEPGAFRLLKASRLRWLVGPVSVDRIRSAAFHQGGTAARARAGVLLEGKGRARWDLWVVVPQEQLGPCVGRRVAFDGLHVPLRTFAGLVPESKGSLACFDGKPKRLLGQAWPRDTRGAEWCRYVLVARTCSEVVLPVDGGRPSAMGAKAWRLAQGG